MFPFYDDDFDREGIFGMLGVGEQIITGSNPSLDR